MKRKKGYFSISAVANMLSIHQQTIRMYEKEGLISPKRSDGNTRLFSEADIDRLEEIIYLTHKIGVNLAGVETILKLQKKIEKLQNEVNSLFEQTHGQLQEESTTYRRQIKEHLSEMKTLKDNNSRPARFQSDKEVQSEIGSEDWKIDYDE